MVSQCQLVLSVSHDGGQLRLPSATLGGRPLRKSDIPVCCHEVYWHGHERCIVRGEPSLIDEDNSSGVAILASLDAPTQEVFEEILANAYTWCNKQKKYLCAHNHLHDRSGAEIEAEMALTQALLESGAHLGKDGSVGGRPLKIGIGASEKLMSGLRTMRAYFTPNGAKLVEQLDEGWVFTCEGWSLGFIVNMALHHTRQTSLPLQIARTLKALRKFLWKCNVYSHVSLVWQYRSSN